MTPILLLWIRLAGFAAGSRPLELSFDIAKESGVSSDVVTLCRVRVVNHGNHTVPGHRIQFEAEAIEGGVVVERARGRFGLSLAPRGTLETLIGFSGRYENFAVHPLSEGTGGAESGRRPNSGGKGKRSGGKGKHFGGKGKQSGGKGKHPGGKSTHRGPQTHRRSR